MPNLLNMPVKYCTDENDNKFSPVVYQESMFNDDGTRMDPVPRKMFAKAYDPTKTYPTENLFCIQNNKYYKFTGSGTTTGTFDPTKWTETDDATELTQLNNTLTQLVTINNILDLTNTQATNVSANLYKITGLPLANIRISFKLTTASPNTGTVIGQFKSNYVPYGGRPIIPCINESNGEPDASIYCNYSSSTEYLKVYNGKANTTYSTQFFMFLQNNVNE